MIPTPFLNFKFYSFIVIEQLYENCTLNVGAHLHLDQLSIKVRPKRRIVGERGTARFTATASGINMNNFTYQWRKRGSNSIPDKVSGVNETVLAIPNLAKSDEGKYFCFVTNEWGRKMKSNDVMLSVEGT